MPFNAFRPSDRSSTSFIPNLRTFPIRSFLLSELPARIKSGLRRLLSMNLTEQECSLGELDPEDRPRFEQLVLPHFAGAKDLPGFMPTPNCFKC